MPFQSILFGQPDDVPAGGTGDGARADPQFLADLNLDQISASMVRGRAQYDLTPYFLSPLREEPAIHYRHQVLRDLENDEVRQAVTGYAHGMEAMRRCLAQASRLHNPHQRQRWFLDAVTTYCEAAAALAGQLRQADLSSDGLIGLREYLDVLVRSGGFRRMAEEIRTLKDRLSEVRYCVHLRGTSVRVTRYDDQADYGADVEQTFARFKQGAVKDYRVPFRSLAELNPVDTQILEFVAQLFPEVFQELAEFGRRHASYVDDILGTFDREVQFYLAYLDYIRPLRSAGLEFCYPAVSPAREGVSAEDAFDLALAAKLTGEGRPVVRNRLQLDGRERAVVVTGPNQGGKTTFARMIGQLHYLASLGLPVPGRSARLVLPDRIFTHFGKEENPQSLRGRLGDELARIHEILRDATGRSVVVMNESFASTSLADAAFLGAEILRRLTEKDLLCVYVTFIDQLASLNQACVSMVAEIAPDDPTNRTFRIVRRPADGKAYAIAIAGKYGLTYQCLKERVAARGLKERIAG